MPESPDSSRTDAVLVGLFWISLGIYVALVVWGALIFVSFTV